MTAVKSICGPVLEDVLDSGADALNDLPGSFGGPDGDVFTGGDTAFANGSCRIDGVEGDQINGALARA